jgi:hypothetical protein
MGVKRQQKLRWLVPLGTVGFLVLAAAICAGQSPGFSGFSLNDSYALGNGAQRDGDQLIMAYTIDLKSESAIDGKATLIGNEASVNTHVAGDLVVIAKRLKLGADAHVAGDLVICVNDLERADGALIDGEIREECEEGGRASISSLFDSGIDNWRGNFLVRLSGLLGSALLFGALAALGVVLVPQPLTRISYAIQHAPLVTGGVGFLTIVIAVGLTAFYMVSLFLVLPVVLFPFVLFGWLVIGLFGLLGWVALAEPFGRTLLKRFGANDQPPLITAVVGAIVLALLLRVWSLLWIVSWVGLLAIVILGSMGVGAVVLTRVGTERYPDRTTGSHTVIRIDE